jgi:hypothetical protein
VVEGNRDGDTIEVLFRFGKARPQLKLVHSA